MDTTAVTTFLSGDATTAITAVAGAALIMVAGLKIWKRLRSAI
jgi:hypothetical protein